MTKTKPKMTAAQMQAVDWAALFALAPEAFALFKKVLDALGAMKAQKKAGCPFPCPEHLRELCEGMGETLTGHIIEYVKLHEYLCGDEHND